MSSSEPQEIAYSDDPEGAGNNLRLGRPIDTIIDGARPAIYLEDKRIAKIMAGGVTGKIVDKPGRFFTALTHGIERTNPEIFEVTDKATERLLLALDLYALSYFEPNALPRFLLQCTALEVIAPPAGKEPEFIAAQVEAWSAEAQAIAKRHSGDAVLQEHFDRLGNNVVQLKRTSHSHRIRTFSRETLERACVADADKKVEMLMRAYHVRGRFLHEGNSNDIGSATTAMHDILPLLLKAALEKGGG